MAQAPAGDYPHSIDLECAQVPHAFGEDSPVWLWLGSDNNKGQETDWTQGIRAYARCVAKQNLGGGKYEISLGDVFLFPRTVGKAELLQASPETYARKLSHASVVGLNNYASQVVQVLSQEEFDTIGAVIARLLPEIRDELFRRVPAADGIDVVPRAAPGGDEVPQALDGGGESPEPLTAQISDEDPIYQEVRNLVIDDAMGGALLMGAPGTGKSWYARQIAIKLTGGDATRIREVQFHPSYQYEDFVEGYIPDPSEGFRLVDKHLLQIAEVARHTEGPVVLIIDEFSRTDPARVLGETMTYMEGSLRGAPFYLPSGRKATIPKNLIFLATMNPDDRSVDEIDAAMDRRWAKITIEPDVDKVRDFLVTNGAPEAMRGPVLEFFAGLQNHMQVGHAFFRTVKDGASLKRLWETQLRFIAKKRFRFDPETLEDVEDLWSTCVEAVVDALKPAEEGPAATGQAQGAEQPIPAGDEPPQPEAA